MKKLRSIEIVYLKKKFIMNFSLENGYIFFYKYYNILL